MTLTEMLAIPKGMSIDEYEFLIDRKHKLEKQITKASNVIYDAEDSLEVLSDEVGSIRYNKHLLKKQKAEAKRDKLQRELNQLKVRF